MWQTVSTACWRILQECSTLLRCNTYINASNVDSTVHIQKNNTKASNKRQYLIYTVSRAWQCSSVPCVMISTTGASTTSSWLISGKKKDCTWVVGYCDVDVWNPSDWHPVRNPSLLVIDRWRNRTAVKCSTMIMLMHIAEANTNQYSPKNWLRWWCWSRWVASK